MEGKKIMEYSMKLSMIKNLRKEELISEAEYQEIYKELKKEYGVVSAFSITCSEYEKVNYKPPTDQPASQAKIEHRKKRR